MNINDPDLVLEEFAQRKKELQQREDQAELKFAETQDKLAYAQEINTLSAEFNTLAFQKTCTLHKWWKQGEDYGRQADASKVDLHHVDIKGADFHDWKNLDKLDLSGAKNIRKAYGIMMPDSMRNLRNGIFNRDQKHQPKRRKDYVSKNY